jgi:hypothetical protein
MTGSGGRSNIPETPVMESKGRGVLDTPQEPVIGLAEGETRWRGMTGFGVEAAQLSEGAKRRISSQFRHFPFC